LVQGADRNFYGPTQIGGVGSCTSGCGTLFKITPNGALKTLHSFDGTDGYAPQNLAQATNGTFYGTTRLDGADNDGTVFSLSVGHGPFVETLPTSGKVGVAIEILGPDLTSATSVIFNGAAASFKVESDTLISAIVPAGATSGFVAVTLPRGTLRSNAIFRVWP
jgi:uncharacterized repeat protein (TIGR03803 family)